jgi:hypothetical protein
MKHFKKVYEFSGKAQAVWLTLPILQAIFRANQYDVVRVTVSSYPRKDKRVDRVKPDAEQMWKVKSSIPAFSRT